MEQVLQLASTSQFHRTLITLLVQGPCPLIFSIEKNMLDQTIFLRASLTGAEQTVRSVSKHQPGNQLHHLLLHSPSMSSKQSEQICGILKYFKKGSMRNTPNVCQEQILEICLRGILEQIL